MEYKIKDIIYQDKYLECAKFCNDNNLVLFEIDRDKNDRRWQILEKMPQTEEQDLEGKIFSLKQELAKYKEDVEQVELFGMERADYEQKKTRCAEIILELRKLESELKSLG